MRVTKSAVIQAASDIADENGLSGVCLKAVAQRLGIKTPSLYNHIAGLDELLRCAAHAGMKTMNERMTNAVIGNSGGAAIKKAGAEYLSCMIEHPGVYEIIQWALWHGTDETAAIYANFTSLLTALIRSCQLRADCTEEALHLLTGVLHGFTTLRLGVALTAPLEVQKELENALDTVLLGMAQKYNE